MIKGKQGSEGAKQLVKTEEDTHDVDHIAKFETCVINNNINRLASHFKIASCHHTAYLPITELNMCMFECFFLFFKGALLCVIFFSSLKHFI